MLTYLFSFLGLLGETSDAVGFSACLGCFHGAEYVTFGTALFLLWCWKATSSWFLWYLRVSSAV